MSILVRSGMHVGPVGQWTLWPMNAQRKQRCIQDCRDKCSVTDLKLLKEIVFTSNLLVSWYETMSYSCSDKFNFASTIKLCHILVQISSILHQQS